MNKNNYVVIMAGGIGSRFWPFSRTSYPKQFHDVLGIGKTLIKYIKERKGQSGVIYCLSRKKVEEIAELLQVNDINALPYHAGLDAHVRIKNQDAFLNEEVNIIV